MKYIIKETGEIKDLLLKDFMGKSFFEDEDGRAYSTEEVAEYSELWENRRYELTKIVISGVCDQITSFDSEIIADHVVIFVDAVIKKMKGDKL